MKKFIIENDFWDLFPKAKIGVIVCTNIDNWILDDEKFKTKKGARSSIEALLKRVNKGKSHRNN